MTAWDFLDRQLNRLKVEHVAGAGVFLLTVLVFFMLRDQPALADNDLFKTLSQAVVVQGLVGLAMAAWFTTKHRDRVTVDNPPSDPVNTVEAKGDA
jgi:hypothetical protein